MNLLILNASPKGKRAVPPVSSRDYSGCFCRASGKKRYPSAADRTFSKYWSCFPAADVVCLFVPLYVDAPPSHVVEFLIQAERYCKSHPCRFRLYALFNNGFVEGKQNRPALHMLQAWCERAGITWGGGVGIGGGVMLRALGVLYPILIGIILLQMALSLFSTGTISGELWRSLAIQIFTWLFLNSGMLFCMARLSSAIRRERVLPNQFTRVMMPSFLFIPIADVFMVLSSLFQGRFLFTLLKQGKWRSE